MTDDLVVQPFDPVEIAKGFVALAESSDWERTRGMSKADALDVCRAYLGWEAQLAKEKAEVMSLCQTLLTNEEQICELSAALVERDAQLATMTLQRNELTRSYDNLLTQWADVLAQLAAMTAERDELSGINSSLVKDFNAMLLANSRLQDKLTASEAARERMQAALAGAEREINSFYPLTGYFSPVLKAVREALAEAGKAGES